MQRHIFNLAPSNKGFTLNVCDAENVRHSPAFLKNTQDNPAAAISVAVALGPQTNSHLCFNPITGHLPYALVVAGTPSQTDFPTTAAEQRF